MGRRNRDPLRTYRYVLVALCAVFLICAVIFLLQLRKREQYEIQYNGTANGVFEYGGKEYVQRQDQEILLVMGLDKFDRPEDYEGYVNDQQSDFLALLILDNTEKTCDVLYLNRDTMTKIRRLGVAGDGAGSFTGQLALAHTYGSGGSDSCLNAVRAVSDLLGGIQIHHYMTLTMDAVGIVNDAVGGVTVEIMDDFTHIDPAMVQGQQVTLMGEQALTYVRSRSTLADTSNLRRMERQQQYLSALYQQVMDRQEKDGNFLARTLLDVSFMSDCSVNQLDGLADKLLTYELQEPVNLKGEAVVGEKHMEFYPDEDALLQTVVQLFCEEK